MDNLDRPQDPKPAEAPRRILLLEDDETFKEIVADFLRDNGFDVVAVTNGVDGVREVMKAEFEIVICDMMMPTLPGDMFYLAVQRMRPHLCKRFIFITGYRGNDRITQFIRRVNGIILMKPFHVADLLDMIGFLQVRSVVSAG